VGPVTPLQVAAKSPGLSLFASAIIPGLGSLMNGDVAIGSIIMICYFLSFILWFVIIGIFITPIVWIWGLIAGYQSAQKWNAEHGIIS
jgi:TM2 domain-containing membrane protein YozV